jgi:phosphoribosylpyrophosphate synthetase
LIECKNALLKQGATDVSAYVTHAIFPEDSWKRFTGSPSYM